MNDNLSAYSSDDSDRRIESVLPYYQEFHIFITFENISLSSPRSEKIAVERWKNFLASCGKSPEEIQSHLDRRGTEVLPITIEQQ